MNDQIVFITSYPPRECGIATYCKDLIDSLQRYAGKSFEPVICALDPDGGGIAYGPDVRYVLRASSQEAYADIAREINGNPAITGVFVQHEFGLFGGDYGDNLMLLLYRLEKPVVITFHSVLPSPNAALKKTVCAITNAVDAIIVMTNHSAEILVEYYDVAPRKITVIPHGIHTLPNVETKQQLRKRYGLSQDAHILTTFGLLGQGKSIETALQALPPVIARFPDTQYLVIGETHPEVIKREGEAYRNTLKSIVRELKLEAHVRFIDRYMPTGELLEYLSLSDLYLFTSKDPNQAVSGTFAYALSCGCPVISTRIPHAKEVLTEDIGTLVGFEQPRQFTAAITELLAMPLIRQRMGKLALQLMAPSAWRHVAIAHANMLTKKGILSEGPSAHLFRRLRDGTNSLRSRVVRERAEDTV
ncbi:glycosyltransferase [Parapedobacter sp. 10938]|uniref:glycosyltransferase n=1 Tax=Parapedobacter flavus TaxID=3110225 RepID=UPI002DBABAF6|nr:glycosyltransferase [Parapedobacter sp. 10938]MEC3879380.1 glycosyltransferase [Parapedobacter sp. 10938]